MTIMKNTVNKPTHKNWLYMSLAAAALTLGACADKEAPINDDKTAMDAQVEVEQGGAGVTNADTTKHPMESDDVAVASEDMTNDDVAVASAEDGVAVGVDDSEMLDGSESEEHVSTS